MAEEKTPEELLLEADKYFKRAERWEDVAKKTEMADNILTLAGLASGAGTLLTGAKALAKSFIKKKTKGAFKHDVKVNVRPAKNFNSGKEVTLRPAKNFNSGKEVTLRPAKNFNSGNQVKLSPAKSTTSAGTTTKGTQELSKGIKRADEYFNPYGFNYPRRTTLSTLAKGAGLGVVTEGVGSELGKISGIDLPDLSYSQQLLSPRTAYAPERADLLYNALKNSLENEKEIKSQRGR